MNPIQFRITELRAKNQQTLLEMLGITVFAMFFGAFAPSLILGLFYSNQQMLEAPWFYQAIPVGSLCLAILYTLYALGTNFIRERAIQKLTIQLINPNEFNLGLEDKETKQLEKMVDKTLMAKRKPAPVQKRSSAKIASSKAAKRTAKK